MGIKAFLKGEDFMKKIGKILAALLLVLVIACGSGMLAARILLVDEQEKTAKEDNSEKHFEFVSLDSVMVNLAEERLTRYLKVTIAFKIEKQYAEKFRALMENGKKAVYTDWLITYLSGLKLEQVKGSESIRRLRGEIKTGFNNILKRETDMQIEAVLFEEFNVQ